MASVLNGKLVPLSGGNLIDTMANGFNNEASFKAIYGVNAIEYAM